VRAMVALESGDTFAGVSVSNSQCQMLNSFPAGELPSVGLIQHDSAS
jgi:hypothetical protein